jgi:hypothetical protein
MSAADTIREAAELLETVGCADYVNPPTAGDMQRVAGELRGLAGGRPELAILRAALDGDDREVHRLLDEMDLVGVAGLRRAVSTVATYAANKEGRLRAADRRRGW